MLGDAKLAADFADDMLGTYYANSEIEYVSFIS